MKKLSLDMIQEYIRLVNYNGMELKDIPIEYQTKEICHKAVNNNVNSIKYIENQTPELCLAAVNKNGLALRYIKSKTPEICLAAVLNDIFAIAYVDDLTSIATKVSDELIDKSIKSTSDVLAYETLELWSILKEIRARMLMEESSIELMTKDGAPVNKPIKSL